MGLRSLLATGVTTGILVPLVLAVTPGVASADPSTAPDTKYATASCDNGRTYEVTTAGEFAPAHVVGSNVTLHPLAFGEEHVVLTRPDGSVAADFTAPPKTKDDAQAEATGQDVLNCSFTLQYDFTDANLGPVHAYVTGTVQAFVAPPGN
jgi:hypothetical protein